MTQHRKQRLADLVDLKFNGNEEELGRALGYVNGNYVRAMLREGPSSRPVTEKTVRKIEALPGLSRWFSGVTEVAPTAARGGAKPRTRAAHPFMDVKSVPVLTFTDLALMESLNTDARLSSAPRIAAAPDTGPRVKALVVFDDSMAPTMRPGDMVQLDPDLQPQAGDKVLVQDSAGTYHLREYRLRSGGAFEAAAHNPAHATLHSEADGLRVVAVATHLTQSLRGGSMLGRAAAGLAGALGALFIGTALYVGEFAPNVYAKVQRPTSTLLARRKLRYASLS